METEGSFVPESEVKPPVKEPLLDLPGSYETVQQFVTELRKPIPEDIIADFKKINEEPNLQSVVMRLTTVAQKLEELITNTDPNIDFSERIPQLRYRSGFFDPTISILVKYLPEIINICWRGTQNSNPAQSAAWESLKNHIKQSYEAVGFEVIEPKLGEQYDDNKHKIDGFADKPGPQNSLARVSSIGLRFNRELSDKAGVIMYRS